MLKYTLALVVSLFLLVGYQAGVNSLKPKTGREKIKSASAKKININQKIELSGRQAIGKRMAVTEGKTALDLLRDNYSVRTEGEGKEAFVTAIADQQADKQKRQFWAFYVNGKLSEVGAGSYQLKDGDKILWRIEKY